MKITPMPEGTGALIARMAADDRKAASAEAPPEPQAHEARSSVASGSPFRFTVGETYELQNGYRVKIVARYTRHRGFETVVDEAGIHRYDRSTSSIDAGRVTATAHDYSHPENIKRENEKAQPRP